LVLSTFVPLTIAYQLHNNNTLTDEGPYTYEDDEKILIGNSHIEIVFDKTLGGGIDQIIDKFSGIDLRPDKEAPPMLYLIYFWNGTAIEGVLQWDAFEKTYTTESGEDYAKITIIHNNLKGYDIHAVITAIIYDDSQTVNLRLSITNNEDFIIKEVFFPWVWGLGQIGSDASDDTFLYPVGDGVLLHNPISYIDSLYLSGDFYPASISMQMMSYYDKNEAGLYLASYDTEGNPKKFTFGGLSWAEIQHLAVFFELFTPEYPGNDFSMEYDTVIGTFNGDWYKAADIYKEWTLSTPFVSGGKIFEEKDTPDWYGSTSMIQLVSRDNPDEPYLSLDEIVKLTEEYADTTQLDTSVLIIGWEKDGAWVGPYYYPPVEGEEVFENAMTRLQNEGNHGFTYITGSVWRITRDDIGYSDYDIFHQKGLPWVALKEDLTPLYDIFYESIGWHSSRMCPMTDFWHELQVHNAVEGARLGVDIIQIDEFPISTMYPCYNASHNHPIGYSKEISYAWRSILQDIRDQGRALNKNLILSMEEPCEFYIPYMDTYVSRDSAPEVLIFAGLVDTYGNDAEFIPLFSYVYHEYILPFGEAVGMDADQPEILYNQMARSVARTYTQGEIIKIGGTTRDKWVMDIFELFKRTATATTTYAKPYVLEGELLIPPDIEVPLIEIQWYNYFANDLGTPFLEPAISHGAWLSDSNAVGLVFANWYTQNVEFDVTLPSYHLHGSYALVETRNNDRVIIQPDVSLPTTITLSMNQNDVLLIETAATVDSEPPLKPTINGPTSGKINTAYTYASVSSDEDAQDYLYYLFDWGDGTTSEWIGPFDSGDICEAAHTWIEEGTYGIKVRVKDSKDVVSEWSDSLELSMPRCKLDFISHLYRYFEAYPILHRLFSIVLKNAS
jgi:uncharacterized protein DUF6259